MEIVFLSLSGFRSTGVLDAHWVFSDMKNKLQYAYSITVFVGVLLSSYVMLQRENLDRTPTENYSAASDVQEATFVDPVVNQLFEFEEALSSQYKKEETEPELPRRPTTDSDILGE